MLKMKQTIYLAVSLAFAILVGFILFDQQKNSNLSFSDFGASLPKNYEVFGIDISHHQGEIDWNQVVDMKIGKDSIQFVFLKLTEGLNFKDDYAAINMKKLQELEVPFGTYHFYRPNQSAAKQANFFVENYMKTALKPVLDIELQGQLKASSLIDSVSVFLQIVHDKLKVRPIIYTYESFYVDFFKSSPLSKEWFWIANYTGQSKAFEVSNIIAWQFTDKGTIDGIKEKADLNIGKSNFWKAAKWE